MAYFTGPNIVTDALALAIDAGSTRSYPGSGTTWKDLSSNGTNGTLTNGPTFNASNGGSFVFDGVDNYVQGGVPVQNTSAATLEVWYKTSADEAFPGENRLLFIGNGFTEGLSLRLRDDRVAFFVRKADNSGYWDIFSGDTVIDGQWKHVVGTFDTTSIKRYENGTLTQQTSTGQQYKAATNGWSVGGYTYFFDGNIAIARFYNKTLTAAEVTQNFNAQKSRFGL